MSDKTIPNRLLEVKIAFTHTPKAIEIIKYVYGERYSTCLSIHR
ncbi:hypothetical protein PSM_B0328 [Pseudoalteromonas sp. SM9913]|nr:hypothetical protein PSM_B0328 [Pseudoalteromonas sp. SM9913]